MWDNLKVVLREVKQYKRPTALSPIFTAGEVLMDVLLPSVIALIIDRGIEAGDLNQVFLWGLVMLLIALASLAFGYFASKNAATASAGFASNLRDAMFENVQRFSFSNIDKFSTSGLVTRMTTDVTNVQNAYQMTIRMAVRAPLTIIAAIIMCLLISPSLSLVYVVAIVVMSVALIVIMASAVSIFNKVFAKYDALNESVEENVGAIRVVKAFVREDHEDKKFNRAADEVYHLFVKAEGRLTLNNPVMMAILNACIIALSWFGAHDVVDGAITTGDLTALFGYVMSILMSLMMLTMVFVMISMSMANVDRISEVLSEQPDITNPANPREEVADGSIDFDHVDFSYRTSGTGDYVLQNIDLHIKSGETIGVIGATGSGKSTLVSLVNRLYDATNGDVKVGGHDVREYDLTALRDAVAVVLQKNTLFTGTILDNLRWGKEDATEEECRQAATWAGADEFIDRFPDGYQTKIEEGGNNVSGGQKQRLCIARALLKHPKILILDDSTSAVDTATDARIQHALSSEIPDMTKIVISQRVSSLASADRILVLDDGRVNGFGTQDELLKTNDIYRDIYEQQTKGGGSGDFDAPKADDAAPAAAATGKDGE